MFGKKKNDNKLVAAEAAAMEIAEKVEKNFIIYTMPKRFLGKQLNAKQAKTTGLVILSLGFLFLLAALGFIYWYFVIRSANLAVKNVANVNNVSIPSVNNNSNNSSNISGNETTSNSVNNVSTEIASTSLPAGVTANEATSSSLQNINVATTTVMFSATTTEEQNSSSAVTASANQPTKTIAAFALDTDGDGLTDAEEAIFGTSVSVNDSDGDSFSDLAEVQNLYNPAGSGKILANSNIDIYNNSALSRSLYFPKAWKASENTSDNSTVLTIDDQQYISVTVQSNAKKQSIEDWYKQLMGVNYISPSQMVKKINWTGVASTDGLNTYLLDPLGNNIYIFSYNLGGSGLVKYKNIFDMMINSFK